MTWQSPSIANLSRLPSIFIRLRRSPKCVEGPFVPVLIVPYCPYYVDPLEQLDMQSSSGLMVLPIIMNAPQFIDEKKNVISLLVDAKFIRKGEESLPRNVVLFMNNYG